MKAMVMETPRLFIRELTMEDYDALYQVLSDTAIMKYYPHAFSEADVRAWINRNIERYRTLGFGLWAVCIKETGAVIGDCGLTIQQINGQQKPEIGYHIRADQQRKGYAAEAAEAVRDWAFSNTDYPAIYSYMKQANEPSRRTAIAYGCTLEEEYVDAENGITSVFAITRRKWIELTRWSVRT